MRTKVDELNDLVNDIYKQVEQLEEVVKNIETYLEDGKELSSEYLMFFVREQWQHWEEVKHKISPILVERARFCWEQLFDNVKKKG